MKQFFIYATSIDKEGDIAPGQWVSWTRKTLAEAEHTILNMMPEYNAGNTRRLLMIEQNFDCDTGVLESKVLKYLRHPLQKKVIYNQKVGGTEKKTKPVYNPGDLDWAAIHALFKQQA